MLEIVQVNLDLGKLGIHPSQLMFRIEGQPVHGQLRLDLHPEGDRMPDEWQDRSVSGGAEEGERTFSLLDLWQGRVMYVHSGSEVLQDFFMFSVFSSKTRELPALARGSRLHRFDVSVRPVNDAPVLSLPEGNVFTLVRNTSRQVREWGRGFSNACASALYPSWEGEYKTKHKCNVFS